jgi:hypothetical protein
MWVDPMIEAYRLKGIASDWVFRDAIGAPGRQSDYEPYFFSMVQVPAKGLVATRLLNLEDDVPALCRLSRSSRRGYTTHPTNMGIGDADQKRLVRWRYVETAEGHTPNFQGGMKES